MKNAAVFKDTGQLNQLKVENKGGYG